MTPGKPAVSPACSRAAHKAQPAGATRSLVHTLIGSDGERRAATARIAA